MCHTIISKKYFYKLNHRYLDEKYKSFYAINDFFIGLKFFKVDKNYGLTSVSFDNSYIFEPCKVKCNDEEYFIGYMSIQDSREQQIDFFIPYRHIDKYYSKKKDEVDYWGIKFYAEAGYHIAPLNSPLENCLKEACYTYTYSEELANLLVGFYSGDVLFYDGRDVSVSKFIIFDPSIFSLDIPYMKDYRDIFNSINKIIKEKNYVLQNIQ